MNKFVGGGRSPLRGCGHLVLFSVSMLTCGLGLTRPAFAQDREEPALRPTLSPSDPTPRLAEPQVPIAPAQRPTPAPSDPTPSLPEPQVPIAPALTGTTVVASDPAADEAAKFKRFDALNEPGLTTNFPGSADSVVKDVGGIRSWLAKYNVGIQGRLATIAVYNPLDTGQPKEPQRYNGQRLTLQTHTLVFETVLGLNDWGLPNSKIIVGMNYLITTFAANGPNTIVLRNLAFYQSFLDRKVELKFGIMPNYQEYVGFFTGGSPVLATGVAGLLPVQAGLSADPVHSPAANLTLHFAEGAYLKTGVQRSISPQGNSYEVMNNPYGLSVSMPGAGPLTIAEVGVLRPATKGGKQVWLRGGGFYNASDYKRFDGKGTENNESAYAAADLQLTQPTASSRPAHGIYTGASAFWNNPIVSTFTQQYEARVYDIGVFKTRPRDTFVVRANYLKYSPDAYKANSAKGVYVNDVQLQATVSYSLHTFDGIYVTPAAAYIHSPSFVGEFKDALAFSMTVYLII